MKIRIDELKNSICTVFEDNAAEYVECAIDSQDETIEIMDRCPWVFDMLEMIRLFISRYIGKAFVITVIGLLWLYGGVQLATAVFYDCAMPAWMLPLCLMIAAKKFGNVVKAFFERV